MGPIFVGLVEVRLDDHSQQEINFCMHELKKVKTNTSGCKFCTCRKKILRMVPIMITLLSHLSALKKFEYLLQPSATSEIWFYLFSRDQPHINLWDKFIVFCYFQIFGRSAFERSFWSKYVWDWILNLYHDFFRQNNCCALISEMYSRPL